MKKICTSLLISLIILTIQNVRGDDDFASEEKVEYFLDLSRFKELSPKIRDYLILLELKKNTKLELKKKELRKIYSSAYPDKKLDKILLSKVQQKFSKKEINKLLAIFESNEMKKFQSIQGELFKEILSEEQKVKSQELSAQIEKLLK